jgi:hypothetical protein
MAALAQIDPATMGLNLYLLIGAAILLGIGFVLAIATWTALRAWIWHLRQRRSQARYRRESFRADGRAYPPFAEGVCYECGCDGDRIYHPPSGERLCLDCYERFWRRMEGRDESPSARPLGAG